MFRPAGQAGAVQGVRFQIWGLVYSSLGPWAGWAVPCGLDLSIKQAFWLLIAGGRGAACPPAGPVPTALLALTSELYGIKVSHLESPGSVPNLHS